MEAQRSTRRDTAIPSTSWAHAALAAGGRHPCPSQIVTTASTQAPGAVWQHPPQLRSPGSHLPPAQALEGETPWGLPCLAAGLGNDGGCVSCPHHQLQRFHIRTGLIRVAHRQHLSRGAG